MLHYTLAIYSRSIRQHSKKQDLFYDCTMLPPYIGDVGTSQACITTNVVLVFSMCTKFQIILHEVSSIALSGHDERDNNSRHAVNLAVGNAVSIFCYCFK